MKSQIIAASTLIAAAAAAPAPELLKARQLNFTSVPDNTPFSVLSIRSGSAVHLASFSAVIGGLDLAVESQNATCESETNTATFYLSSGSLYLYTPEDITQQVYVDRSGMGQGVIQYSTSPGGYGAGRNSETVGWAVDETGELNFDGDSLLACPSSANSTAGPYSIWLNTGDDTPAGLEGCLGISSKAVPVTEANACTYTFTPATTDSE